MYPSEDVLRAAVYTLFRDNKIILFPQTADFEDLSKRKNLRWLKEVTRAAGVAKRLTMCARERVSYDFMKTHFHRNEVALTPDIVMRYEPHLPATAREEGLVLMCMRQDKERAVGRDVTDRIEQMLTAAGYHIEHTDMIQKHDSGLSAEELRIEVDAKIGRFAKAQIIITDRLHGMILAYLAGTPCIVFSNINHKVRACCQWIADCGYIFYADNACAGTVLVENYINGNLEVSRNAEPIDDTYFQAIIDAALAP